LAEETLQLGGGAGEEGRPIAPLELVGAVVQVDLGEVDSGGLEPALDAIEASMDGDLRATSDA
jgi:hypothetical protein